jgi:hypothetical protein
MARGDGPWAAFCIDGVENRGSREKPKRSRVFRQSKNKSSHRLLGLPEFVTSKARQTYGQGTL